MYHFSGNKVTVTPFKSEGALTPMGSESSIEVISGSWLNVYKRDPKKLMVVCFNNFFFLPKNRNGQNKAAVDIAEPDHFEE